MPTLKSSVKKVLPAPVLAAWRRLRLEQIRRAEARLSLEEVFTTIYKTNVWGGIPGEFYSGLGSEDAFTGKYVHEVNRFIAEHGVRTILDVGCGDFRVGSKITRPGIHYLGIDIVRPLIERNARLFGSDFVRFEHKNAVEDELPDADLCLIREVLQHLSNDQIVRILGKLGAFRHVLISDVRPAVVKAPNVDKTAGSAIRAFVGSCVALDASPFSLPNVTLLFKTPGVPRGSTICTYLISNEAADVRPNSHERGSSFATG